MTLPTARAARGVPASRATSPYVATRPGGMLRTMASTRRCQGVASTRGMLHQREGVDVVVGWIDRRNDRRGTRRILARLPQVHVDGEIEPAAVAREHEPHLRPIGIGAMYLQHDGNLAGVELHQVARRINTHELREAAHEMLI